LKIQLKNVITLLSEGQVQPMWNPILGVSKGHSPFWTTGWCRRAWPGSRPPISADVRGRAPRRRWRRRPAPSCQYPRLQKQRI